MVSLTDIGSRVQYLAREQIAHLDLAIMQAGVSGERRQARRLSEQRRRLQSHLQSGDPSRLVSMLAVR